MQTKSCRVFIAAAAVLLSAASLRSEEAPPSPEGMRALRKLEAMGAKAVPPIIIADSARCFREVEAEQRAWSERVMVQPALARIAAESAIAAGAG